MKVRLPGDHRRIIAKSDGRPLGDIRLLYLPFFNLSKEQFGFGMKPQISCDDLVRVS